MLSGLSWSTPDGTPLFTDLDLSFGPGRTGLVGRNGCGKSTLLRLLAGEIRPAAGSVTRAGNIGWMRQETGQPDGTVAQALGISHRLSCIDRLLRGEGTADDAAAADWTLGERLGQALARVGLDQVDPRQALDTLSGGQRTRLALARVLLEAPDILLLDEPTNNLDGAGRALVADLLREWRGCVVVASHDRALLEDVDAIVDIANGSASVFGGPWSAFAADRMLRLSAARAALDLAERAARRSERAAQAQRERQARRDGRGRADRAKGDAPKMLFDARQERAERTTARGSRIAQRRQAEVAQTLAGARAAVEILAPLRIDLPAATRIESRPVLDIRAATLDFGSHKIVGPLDLLVRGDERVSIRGPNGSGKSALLRLAAGILTPTTGSVVRAAGRVAILDQHVGFLRDDDSLIAAMHRANPDLPRNETHAALARFAFRDRAVDRRCGTLSGGERMRLGLACVVSGPEPLALLLLDEPTNHLDIDAVDLLADALRGYCGALVVASHDQRFLDAAGVVPGLVLG